MAAAALWICAALALSFLINLVPAFMPSTWMVLAFFYIKFNLPLLLLTIPGAIVSGLGRLLLAKGSALFKRRLIKEEEEGNLQELGRFLNARRNTVGLVVFLYSLTPLPTNNLFVAAGMTEVEMTRVLAGFWCARILANTFWVWATNRVFQSLGGLFETTFSSWPALLLQLTSVSSIVLLYKLPWARWLSRLATRGSDGRPKAARR